LPPTGGLGMNTGIADAHNLAWKLAFILHHHAPDTLLDTYDEERRPTAKRNIEWSTENAARFSGIFKAIHERDNETLKIKLHEQQKNLNFEGLDLGFIYHSKAVQSENDNVLSILPDKYIPTTLPGSRAPYVKLIKEKRNISTLDLFEKTYVLFVGSDGYAWQVAANQLTQSLSLPLVSYKVANDGDLLDPDNTWHTTYEITITGAVLVRPDGHVAWRSKEMVENPKEILSHVFRAISLGNVSY